MFRSLDYEFKCPDQVSEIDQEHQQKESMVETNTKYINSALIADHNSAPNEQEALHNRILTQGSKLRQTSQGYLDFKSYLKNGATGS